MPAKKALNLPAPVKMPVRPKAGEADEAPDETPVEAEHPDDTGADHRDRRTMTGRATAARPDVTAVQLADQVGPGYAKRLASRVGKPQR